jgi:hypothetical protein
LVCKTVRWSILQVQLWKQVIPSSCVPSS